MDTKLTLKMDSTVIAKAKSYASHKNTSLSRLIESYLLLLVESKDRHPVTPLVKSLSGVVDVPPSFDARKSHQLHLLKKYTK